MQDAWKFIALELGCIGLIIAGVFLLIGLGVGAALFH